MKLFCDTNILIDYLSRRQPYFEDVLKLRIAALCGDVELWMCPQSFTDAEYILRSALPLPTLREKMRACLSFIHIAVPSADSLAQGLASDWPDLEDYLIAHCAREQGAHYLITRDTKGFQSAELPAWVPVFTPHEFLEFTDKEFGITYEEIELF